MGVANTTFFGSGVIIEAVISIEDRFGIEFPGPPAFRIKRVLSCGPRAGIATAATARPVLAAILRNIAADESLHAVALAGRERQ